MTEIRTEFIFWRALFFGRIFVRLCFFFSISLFFQKSEVDDFSGLIAQNSEEYNNKGGCKNKKSERGGPSLGEVRPQHMCLASCFARVLAAERRKDGNCTWAPLFSRPRRRTFWRTTQEAAGSCTLIFGTGCGSGQQHGTAGGILIFGKNCSTCRTPEEDTNMYYVVQSGAFFGSPTCATL